MNDPILGITEQWDTDALIEIRNDILKPASCPPLPSPLRIRTGAVPGTKGTSQKVLGYYVTPDKAVDGVPSFYVSPLVGDTLGALTVLTWLATFAAYPHDDWKEYSRRSKLAERIGFEKPYTTPKASATLLIQLEEIATTLIKPRPHASIDVSKTPIIRTQNTNLLTGACPFCNGKHRPTLATLQAGWPECSGNGTHKRVLVNVWSGTKVHGLTPIDPQQHGIPCRRGAQQHYQVTGRRTGGWVDIFEPI